MSNISKFYQFVYYKFYYWHYKRFGESDLPALTGLLQLSLLLYANILTLILIVDTIFSSGLFMKLTARTFIQIGLASAILIFNYLLLMHRRKSKTIFDKFENDQALVGKAYYVYLYILGSILSLAGIVLIYKVA